MTSPRPATIVAAHCDLVLSGRDWKIDLNAMSRWEETNVDALGLYMQQMHQQHESKM